MQKVPSRRGRSSDLQKDVTSTPNAVYVDEAEPFGITSFCSIFPFTHWFIHHLLTQEEKRTAPQTEGGLCMYIEKFANGSKMEKMNLILIIYHFYLCVCVNVCHRCAGALGGQQRASALPCAGVTGSCEPTDMGAGNLTLVSAGAVVCS